MSPVCRGHLKPIDPRLGRLCATQILAVYRRCTVTFEPLADQFKVGYYPAGGFLDFQESVSTRQHPGSVYVYQPRRHKHGELIAKACKSLFFEAVLDSEARGVPDPSMPLAGCIADEFQRFPTAEQVHGEQFLLGVCRSFGAFAVLACQSIASLRYALCDMERDPDKRHSAIDITCNNTATKLFFRSTDEGTARRVRTVSPRMAGAVQ